MSKELKLVGYGVLSWLIPFLVGYFLCKVTAPLMQVITILTISVLLVLYFQSIKKISLNESIIAGLVWLVINVGLDLLVLVLNKTRIVWNTYLLNDFIVHLAIPIIAITLGFGKKK